MSCKASFVAVLTFLALTISYSSALANPQSEPGSTQAVAQQTPQMSTGEHRLIAAVNQYRARFKLAPLEADPTLMRVARERAPFVSARRGAGAHGYNHHACGRWCREHARSAGFPGPATDNLAMGYETPEGAVGGWASEDGDQNPAGHNFQMRGRAKINGRWVDEGYNRIGVGIVGRNYIAIFGRGATVR